MCSPGRPLRQRSVRSAHCKLGRLTQLNEVLCCGVVGRSCRSLRLRSIETGELTNCGSKPTFAMRAAWARPSDPDVQIAPFENSGALCAPHCACSPLRTFVDVVDFTPARHQTSHSPQSRRRQPRRLSSRKGLTIRPNKSLCLPPKYSGNYYSTTRS